MWKILSLEAGAPELNSSPIWELLSTFFDRVSSGNHGYVNLQSSLSLRQLLRLQNAMCPKTYSWKGDFRLGHPKMPEFWQLDPLQVYISKGRYSMKRLNFHTVLLTLLFIVPAQFAQAQGIIATRLRHVSQIERLTLKQHDVNVSIDNQLATTKIDQVFANPNDFQLEGTYLFPLPDDVAVSDFVLYIDGKPVKAELLPKDSARQTYESIVRALQDPALLEYIGSRAFRARVFPIPPRGERRIQLEYTQIINVDAGLAKYIYPLRTDTFTAQPVGSLAVSIALESKHAFKTIYSPSHKIAINRKSDYRAHISYEATNVTVKRDFVCYYSLSDKDFGIDLIAHRNKTDEDGYFMLLISPKYEVQKTEIIEKDFIFVLDRSGSMEGEKIKQAKAALHFCVRNLNAGDRFNLILFNTDVETFSEKLVAVKYARLKALDFIRDIEATGGTNINDALLTALADKPATKRPRIIIFLTDGEPTVGETTPAQVLKNVSKANRNQARIFVFGVGYDVNVNLLDKMAEQNGGTRQYVEPQENLEIAVSSFFTKVSEPVLVNLELDMGTIPTKSLYPRQLPDLFRGSQLTVLGRYAIVADSEMSIALKLIGDIRGERQEFSNTVQFPTHEPEHEFLPRLWAQRKVAYLVDEVRLNGENKELIDEITRISEKYGIMTPYTSFLVTENTPDGAASRGLRNRRMARAMGPQSRPKAKAGKSVPKLVAKRNLSASKLSTTWQDLKLMEAEAASADRIKRIANKTFHLREETWVDSEHKAETATMKIEFGGDAYFELIAKEPELGKYLAIGKHIIVCYKGTCYEIQPKPVQE